jgi:hypothetical protein
LGSWRNRGRWWRRIRCRSGCFRKRFPEKLSDKMAASIEILFRFPRIRGIRIADPFDEKATNPAHSFHLENALNCVLCSVLFPFFVDGHVDLSGELFENMPFT